jgi:hypothetical protein
MATALKESHALRVMHRNIRKESFIGGRLTGWDYAVMNPGNTSFVCSVRHKLNNPTKWNIPAPEFTDDDIIEYGFEYDMWCFGVLIFEMIYKVKLLDNVDIKSYTNEWLLNWISSHKEVMEIKDVNIYVLIMKLLLNTDPTKRPCSSAIANMCDAPYSKNISWYKDNGLTFTELKRASIPKFSLLIIESMVNNRETVIKTANRLGKKNIYTKVNITDVMAAKSLTISDKLIWCIYTYSVLTHSVIIYNDRTEIYNAPVEFDILFQAICNGDSKISPLGVYDNKVLHEITTAFVSCNILF